MFDNDIRVENGWPKDDGRPETGPGDMIKRETSLVGLQGSRDDVFLVHLRIRSPRKRQVSPPPGAAQGDPQAPEEGCWQVSERASDGFLRRMGRQEIEE